MKLLIIITFLCQSLNALAQSNDSVGIIVVADSRRGIGTSENGNGLTVWSDSVWEIQGDTMAVIKLLWKRMGERTDRHIKTMDEKEEMRQVLLSVLDRAKKDNATYLELLGKRDTALLKAERLLTNIQSRLAAPQPDEPVILKWVISFACLIAVMIFYIVLSNPKPSHNPPAK